MRIAPYLFALALPLSAQEAYTPHWQDYVPKHTITINTDELGKKISSKGELDVILDKNGKPLYTQIVEIAGYDMNDDKVADIMITTVNNTIVRMQIDDTGKAAKIVHKRLDDRIQMPQQCKQENPFNTV